MEATFFDVVVPLAFLLSAAFFAVYAPVKLVKWLWRH
jgi:hypothetical protein